MNLRKLSKPLAAGIIFASLLTTGCSKSESKKTADEKQTITIEAWNGSKEKCEVTVPYKPQRVAILDLAVLDILDNLNLGDTVKGCVSTSIEYLKKYPDNKEIIPLGNVKEADFEAVMECNPDIIFIGGRLASSYDELSKIAPVVYLDTTGDEGLYEITKNNALKVGSIFGKEDEVVKLMDKYKNRIEVLREKAQGKTAIIGMCTNGGFSVLGNNSRCSIIGNEIGFTNVGIEFAAKNSSGPRGGQGQGGKGGQESQGGRQSSGNAPAHGNEVSFEFIVKVDPDYMFVLDRDSAIGTNGVKLAPQIIENELVKTTNVYKSGHIVYLKHSDVWYTAEGGITAFDYMLQDLEGSM